MIDNLENYLSPFPQHLRLNLLREYLQKLILKTMGDLGYLKKAAFVGGTALRVIYSSDRFSEDLDFSTLSRKGFSFKEMAELVKRSLTNYGLAIELHGLKEARVVASCFIRFPELLGQLKLSPSRVQKLSIKIEIDFNPPAGAVMEEFLVMEPFLFSLNHYTLESLFAGKLHAILFRPWAKGRDYYDLMFYLRKKPGFNFRLFKNAVLQTHPEIKFHNVAEVKELLLEKLKSADFKQIVKDVAPFLPGREQADQLTRKNMLMAVKQSFQ
jgi:predicted nucleotidyltransferase component of viral defense system